MLTKDQIDGYAEIAAKATPGPWKRSYFVDSPRYRRMPEEWKQERREEERKIIRAGPVGRPAVNVLFRIESAVGNPDDLDFVAAARDAVPDLIAHIRVLERALWLAGSNICSYTCVTPSDGVSWTEHWIAQARQIEEEA
jgi:hypothetical protein